MRTRSGPKFLASALGLAAVVCFWLYLAPVGLGGSTSYVVTHGTSMEPRFHAGDLALVRSRSNYKVGEIVAYHSRAFHTVVLHRIIGRAGSKYVFKGDNNNFVDFEHPSRSQLIGALWLHVAGAGATLESLRSPALTGGLVGLGTLILLGAAFTGRRRRRARQRRDERQTATPRRLLPWRAGEPDAGLLGIGIVGLLPFVALALLAFTRASSSQVPVSVPYTQSGTLTYAASASPGPTYTGNRAVTGDPLFTHVLSRVALKFGYRFKAAPAHSLAGRVAIYAKVTSSSGWQTTLALGPASKFHGDRVSASGQLELASLLALMQRIEKATAVNGSYTLSIEPRVKVAGRLDDVALQAAFSPKIQFSLNALEIRPLSSSGSAFVPGQTTASPFAPSASYSLTGQHRRALFLSFAVVRVPVATARVIAIGGIAILLCALWAAMAFVRPRREGELAEILSRYGRLIVPVSRVWPLPGVAVIDVTDMEALARIAEHYDRSILHETTDEGDALWVADESGQFRYLVGAPGPAVVAAEEADAAAQNGFHEAELAPDTLVPAPVPAAEQPSAFEVAVQADWAAYQVANAIVAEGEEWGGAGEASDASLYDW